MTDNDETTEVRCEECGAPATHVGMPSQTMDAPGRQWQVCDLDLKTLKNTGRIRSVKKI